eukprot:s49_g79.t1
MTSPASSGGASFACLRAELSRGQARRCLEIEIQCIARWSHGCRLELMVGLRLGEDPDPVEMSVLYSVPQPVLSLKSQRRKGPKHRKSLAELNEAARGRTEEVQRLLRSGVQVDCRAWLDETALAAAARHGHLKTAELLLQHGANVDAKNEDGKTPLSDAARRGHLQVAKLLLQRGARASGVVIRMDKVQHCDHIDQDVLDFLEAQEKVHVGAHLTTGCLASMSQTVAKFWFEHGGNPWMSTPDGTRYVQLIKGTEVRKYWQGHMRTSILLQQTARDWKTWAAFFGGLLVAGFGLLLQKLLQKRQSPYRLILEEAATEPSFRMGARLLVAKHLGKSQKMARLAWRSLEVNANVVCQFGIVMLVVWWPFFLPLYGLAFALPGLWKWRWKLVQAPPLMVASATPWGRFGAGCRWAVLFSMAVVIIQQSFWIQAALGLRQTADSSDSFDSMPLWLFTYLHPQDPVPWVGGFLHRIWNPLADHGGLLWNKAAFLWDQHLSVPSWRNLLWPWWHHVIFEATSWTAMHLVVLLFWVPTVVLSAEYFLVACCGKGAFLVACCGEGSNSGASKEVQRAMVQKVLEEQPSTDADGTPFIAVDGVRFTAEVGFSVYRFFESIWTKVLLVLLDIILDANTVFTLITAQQYRIALALQLVVSYSLLHQVMDGQIQRIFEAARASAARGLLRDDLIALLHQEHGFEAFFSLAITSYSLLFAVSTAAQIPVQVFSILLSVYGLATFLYEQVDLELAEDDEEVTSSDDEGTSSKASSGLESPSLIQCMSY